MRDLARGVPTWHKGRRYRSRLEARWAAMFDLLGWRYEYEPYDLPGWIPDFVLLGEQKTLVEVKPYTTFEEYETKKLAQALTDYHEEPREVLLLGASLAWTSNEDHPVALGWLGELVARPDKCWIDLDFAPAILVRSRQGFDFHHRDGSWIGRMTGALAPAQTVIRPDEADWMWQQAANAVQWRPQ